MITTTLSRVTPKEKKKWTIHCSYALTPFVEGLCGANIRWSHDVNTDDVYGVWYGVGYVQHSPDLTNRPNEVGCVTLYITDIDEPDVWRDWTIPRGNFSDESWRSYKSNPWSENSLSGSWLDVRLKRKAKRETSSVVRIRVLWDEDGHTLEQTYIYYKEAPGFWTEENNRPWEKLMESRGIDIWYPDEPPHHPDVIKIIKLTPTTLILTHCSEVGNGGIFSLILRRSPSRVQRWEWYQYKREFNHFELPNVYRQVAICSNSTSCCPRIFFITGITVLFFAFSRD